jgi:hypothetical protein
MIFKYKSNNIWPFIATRRARAPLARATGTVGVVPRFSSSSPRVTRVCCFSLQPPFSPLISDSPRRLPGRWRRFFPIPATPIIPPRPSWRRRPDASPSFPPAEATRLEVVPPPPSAGTGKCRSAWAWIDSFFWWHRGQWVYPRCDAFWFRCVCWSQLRPMRLGDSVALLWAGLRGDFTAAVSYLHAVFPHVSEAFMLGLGSLVSIRSLTEALHFCLVKS